MSTTTTTTTTSAPIQLSLPTKTCCPKCGSDVPAFADTQAALRDAQAKMAELHEQVHLLNEKATLAVDRWADYEDELAQLRNQLNRQSAQFAAAERARSVSPTALKAPVASSTGRMSGLAALLSPRRSTATPQPTSPQPPASSYWSGSYWSGSPSVGSRPPPSPTPSADDLMEALGREQSLRLAAEGKLNETSAEVEELSVKLFEQANEMVATERRARHQLEQRVQMLEKRDADKVRRLERLESAMTRIQRVKAMLGEHALGRPDEGT